MSPALGPVTLWFPARMILPPGEVSSAWEPAELSQESVGRGQGGCESSPGAENFWPQRSVVLRLAVAATAETASFVRRAPWCRCERGQCALESAQSLPLRLAPGRGACGLSAPPRASPGPGRAGGTSRWPRRLLVFRSCFLPVEKPGPYAMPAQDSVAPGVGERGGTPRPCQHPPSLFHHQHPIFVRTEALPREVA